MQVTLTTDFAVRPWRTEAVEVVNPVVALGAGETGRRVAVVEVDLAGVAGKTCRETRQRVVD